MPQLKPVTVSPAHVRNGDIVELGPDLGSSVAKVAVGTRWVTITLTSEAKPLKLDRHGAPITVRREFPTPEETAAADRKYAVKQLTEWLDANGQEAFNRTLTNAMQRTDLTPSVVESLIMAEAVRGVASRFARNVEVCLSNGLNIVNAAVHFAEHVHEQRRQYGPNSPFARSTAVIRNLMDDSVKYAEDKFLDNIKWSVSADLYAEAKKQNAAWLAKRTS